jgi:hypothetical protein
MKLLNMLKTVWQPSYKEGAPTARKTERSTQELRVKGSSRLTAMQLSSGQNRRQSEALKNLLHRADAIGSSR